MFTHFTFATPIASRLIATMKGSAVKLTAGGLILAVLALVSDDAVARRSGAVRTQAIDMVVIHSTGGPTCDAATGKPIWVSAGKLEENLRQIEAHPVLGIHYMIDRDGTVRASVPENQVAHHVYRVSGRSIAIELINNGDGVDPFPAAQLTALVNLLKDIRVRHGITREGIKRHSDLDHTRLPCDRTRRRKVDPGNAFPYESILDQVFSGEEK
jgi:N-acetylmuramoyl-L-alanine amidase